MKVETQSERRNSTGSKTAPPASYLQSLKHDGRLAWGPRVAVFRLMPHSLQQPAVVCGGGDGLSADILHGAEGLRPQTQLMEALLQQRVGVAHHLGV